MPNLEHWFRRYVVIDLARILSVIRRSDITASERQFFEVVFASIIRNSSNADPVPVSGLEVTSHMRQRDADGRLVNPFAYFRRAQQRAVQGVSNFYESSNGKVRSHITVGDAARLSQHGRHKVDAVICSPPYHGAVDYYRRHKLEMFWLGLTTSQQE